MAGAGPQLVAIKVFRPQVQESSIGSEIAVLSRFQHPHVVRMLDLATGPRNAPCLVLQHLAPSGLQRLLADRTELTAGEAVTILAPLLAAVTAMHQAGVVHGSLGTHAVLFDDSGAPMLSGFGAGAVVAPPGGRLTAAALDLDAGVAADREAVRLLVGSVLGRVRGTAVEDFVRSLGERQAGLLNVAELERGLFALASPVPVRFEAESSPSAVPHRLDPLTGVPKRVEGRGGKGTADEVAAPIRPSRSNWLQQIALPPEIAVWASELLARAPAWAVSGMAAATTAVRSVRRGVWVVAGIGLVAVIAAVGLTLGSTSEGADAKSDVELPVSDPSPSPPIPQAASEDDPIEAARSLLGLRAQCLSDRSILCLDAVHAPDSAAWRADAARIRAVEGGAETSPDEWATADRIELIDRMGDTALLTIEPGAIGRESLDPAEKSEPAPVLMIRTEAGWRFRTLPANH